MRLGLLVGYYGLLRWCMEHSESWILFSICPSVEVQTTVGLGIGATLVTGWRLEKAEIGHPQLFPPWQYLLAKFLKSSLGVASMQIATLPLRNKNIMVKNQHEQGMTLMSMTTRYWFSKPEHKKYNHVCIYAAEKNPTNTASQQHKRSERKKIRSIVFVINYHEWDIALFCLVKQEC